METGDDLGTTHNGHFNHIIREVSPALQFHMELPVPRQDLGAIQRWMEAQDRGAIARYVAWRYPRHRLLIGSWLQGNRVRGHGVWASMNLVG